MTLKGYIRECEYMRQILIKVACNNMDNYTILSLAKSTTENESQRFFNYIVHLIELSIGEWFTISGEKGYYPLDRNTEILGLTEEGKFFYESFKDDIFWNEAQRRASYLGGVSFQAMANCCNYLREYPETLHTWHPTEQMIKSKGQALSNVDEV